MFKAPVVHSIVKPSRVGGRRPRMNQPKKWKCTRQSFHLLTPLPSNLPPRSAHPRGCIGFLRLHTPWHQSAGVRIGNLPFGDMECRLERTAGRCPTSCTLRRPSVPKQFPQPNAFLGSRGVCSLVKAYWIGGRVIRTVPIGSNQDVQELVRA